MNNLFRKNVAKGSFSDEQLDKALIITPASLWIAILAGFLIIGIVLAWSILGTMPIKVAARGIYVPSQDSYTLASEVTGIVKSVEVEVGDEVKVGDVLYTIDTKTIDKEIEDLENRIDAVNKITTTSKNDAINSDTQSLLEIKFSLSTVGDNIEQNETMLGIKKEDVEKLKQDVKELKDKALEKQNALTAAQIVLSGLTEGDPGYSEAAAAVAKLTLELSEVQSKFTSANALLNSANAEIDTIKQQIDVLNETNKITTDEYVQRFETAKKLVLYNLNSQLEKYKYTLENNTVASSVKGIVSDVKVSVGSAIGQGSGAVTIRATKDDEDVVICYVGITDGKKIKEGMSVKVYPSIVNKNEYGNIEAVVLSVDDYVTTATTIKNDLADDSLTQVFMSQGPVIGVKCKLQKDDTTASGYKWSSKKASVITIPQGTIVNADIIVEEKKPITMLIPYIKDQIENFGSAVK